MFVAILQQAPYAAISLIIGAERGHISHLPTTHKGFLDRVRQAQVLRGDKVR